MDELRELLELLARFGELNDEERARVDELSASVFRVEGEGDDATRPVLAEATDEDLDALESALLEVFDTVRADEAPDIDLLRALASEGGLVDAVRGEQSRRDAQAEEAAAEIEELSGRILGETPPEGEGDGDAGDGATGEGEGEGETPPEGAEGQGEGDTRPEGEGAGDGERQEEREPEPVGAAGSRRVPLGRLASRRPSRRSPREASQRPRPRMVGPNGRELADMNEVAQAMIDTRRHFLGVVGGISEKVPVVKMTVPVNPDRHLANDAEVNERRINGFASLSAITAAGGSCPPFEIDYSMEVISGAQRPVRDSLARSTWDRGGIKFRPNPSLADVRAGVGQWTLDNDAEPGSDGPATKPIVEVECPEELTAELYAVTRRIKFGNINARTDPERVAALNELLLAAHAEKGEQLLLQAIKDGSTAVSAGQALGAARDILYYVGVGVAGYRSRHRLRDEVPLRLEVPRWLMDAMREDIARGLPAYPDQLAVARTAIEGWFRARSVNVTEYVDSSDTGNQVFPGQGAGQSLLDFPDAVEWALFAEGAWVFGELPELDLGLVRDSSLNEVNKFENFAESFEGVAFRGVESLWVTQELCPNGSSAGTVDPTELCSGQYVPSV